VRAERNLAHFMLFILFFPHLMAGPIVRARDFLPQVRRPRHWSWLRLHLATQYLLLGLFKKLAIADRMAAFVDPVFADPGAYGSAALWQGALAFALQLYCDFSGYTDMALGLAHAFGYKLSRNFDMPYLSANVSEFWKRWHISLSTWIRDYVYIPLGGNRGGRWLTFRNLLLTMTLAGLWHGASWNFVVWGAVHGLLLIAHHGFQHFCAGRQWLSHLLRTAPGTALRVALTFGCWSCSLILFRTATLSDAATMCRRMLTAESGPGAPLYAHSLWLTVAAVALAHALGRRGLWRKLFAAVPVPVRGMAYGAALTLALLLPPQATRAFIYFQF
jgi:alginate O-acetyltransferase complex protein AlgI